MIITKLTDQGLKDGRKTISDIKRTISSQISDAEMRLGEAEARLNGLKQLIGFVDMMEETFAAEQLRREQ